MSRIEGLSTQKRASVLVNVYVRHYIYIVRATRAMLNFSTCNVSNVPPTHETHRQLGPSTTKTRRGTRNCTCCWHGWTRTWPSQPLHQPQQRMLARRALVQSVLQRLPAWDSRTCIETAGMHAHTNININTKYQVKSEDTQTHTHTHTRTHAHTPRQSLADARSNLQIACSNQSTNQQASYPFYDSSLWLITNPPANTRGCGVLTATRARVREAVRESNGEKKS